MGEMHGLVLKVNEAEERAMEGARKRWMGVMKPLGSLGEFENLVIKLAGIYGREYFSKIRACVLVACADNGVVDEGVSQSDSHVTKVVAEQIALGRSNINVMAAATGAEVYVADLGMKEEPNPSRSGREYYSASCLAGGDILDMHVARSTGSIAKGPAMTTAQALKAIDQGRELVSQMRDKGYNMVVTGEMGIGNTTTASALTAALLNRKADEVTGIGAGLPKEKLLHKIEVVGQALEKNGPFSDEDPIDTLAKLGGFDVAAMCGMFLGGMEMRLPVIIDGFISSVAALLASRIEPRSKDFMLPSIMSGEPAGLLVFEELGMEPVIRAGMRLGEGTGGVCLLPLLGIALAEYGQAHRFGDTEVEQYVNYDK